MAIIVDGRRLYCTTSDTFIPFVFESDAEAESFLVWMFKNHGDPRQYPGRTGEFYEQFKAQQ